LRDERMFDIMQVKELSHMAKQETISFMEFKRRFNDEDACRYH